MRTFFVEIGDLMLRHTSRETETRISAVSKGLMNIIIIVQRGWPKLLEDFEDTKKEKFIHLPGKGPSVGVPFRWRSTLVFVTHKESPFLSECKITDST